MSKSTGSPVNVVGIGVFADGLSVVPKLLSEL
jgi:hypothetical protein